MKFGDIGKEIGRRWRMLTEEQKAPYTAKQVTDKARYQRELEEFNELNKPDSDSESGSSGSSGSGMMHSILI